MLTLTGLGISNNAVYAQGHVATLSPGQSITAKTSFATLAAGFQWYRNGVAIPGANNATYVINVPGVYAVQAFNLESCPSPMSESFEIRLAAATADVAVDKRSESRQVTAGETFEYTIAVNNKGAAQATNVMVKDVLPANIAFVSASPASAVAPLYDNATRTLTWTIPLLDPNTSASVSFLVKSLQAGAVSNTATVTASEPDINLTNNTSTDIKNVNPLVIPNIFTPNGDGKNETFIIPPVLTSVANEIQIFNRWGNLIYEKKNYNNEWAGNGLNEGTYFYILKAQGNNGEWDTYKGYVTLLRSKQL